MALIDEVNIVVQSGGGGNGCVSFRREKYIPFGGPNGGNGGSGGSVYLKATRNKFSLLDFKYKPKFIAERGEHGLGKDMYGAGADDLVLSVPVGTIIFDGENQELLCDLSVEGETILVAQGGRGGRGNLSFKSSTNRAPRTATPGELGVTRQLHLQLRLMADVGLVGLPNAGKSSFLRSISRAQPKVADYPFTTLQPSLGVVENKTESFVVADLPGLIEGASGGAGLGYRFLKHVARNRLLLHLVEIDRDPEELKKKIQIIAEELRKYDETLLDKETHLVFTKTDLIPGEELKSLRKIVHQAGLEGWWISSATGFGVQDLIDFLSARLQALKLDVFSEVIDTPVLSIPAA